MLAVVGLAVPASLLAANPQPSGPPAIPAPGAVSTTTTTAGATPTTPATTTTSTTTTAPTVTSAPAPASYTSAPPHGKSGSSVSIVDGANTSSYAFAPSSITISTGDSVTWTNNGKLPHTATGDSFDSGTLSPGKSFTQTFSSAGTFNYICSVHPFMKGTVTVQAATPPAAAMAARTRTAAAPAQDVPTTPPTDPTSESAAGTSPTAAGTSSTLPQTGLDLLALGFAGALLVAGGLALRRAWEGGR